MTGFPRSPRLLRGGLVLLNPTSGTVQKVLPLQYNPDSITRTLQVQDMGDSGNRADSLRLKGPAIETIKLEAEIDLTDELERGNPTALQLGLQPVLAALELIIQPTSRQLQNNNSLADSGALEVVPMETALCVLVWSRNRVMPVKVTDFSITEDAFDTSLNPIRARVSLGLRVLTVTDLGFAHKGGTLFMAYLQQKERMAARAPAGRLSMLGLENV
jgi:hypothetical protein